MNMFHLQQFAYEKRSNYFIRKFYFEEQYLSVHILFEVHS